MHYTSILQLPARVSATAFGKYSFDLEPLSYINTDDCNEFLATQENFMLQIMTYVKDAGTVPVTVAYELFPSAITCAFSASLCLCG